MADQEIIVIGSRFKPQNPAVIVNYGNGRYGYKSTEPNVDPIGRPSGYEDGDGVVVAIINDEAKRTDILAAAENVAKAVAILDPKVDALSGTATVTLNGRTMTGAQFKAI